MRTSILLMLLCSSIVARGGALVTKHDSAGFGQLAEHPDRLALETKYGIVEYLKTDVVWFTTNAAVMTFAQAAEEAYADRAPVGVVRLLAGREKSPATEKILQQLDRDLRAKITEKLSHSWDGSEPLNLNLPALTGPVIVQKTPTAALALQAEWSSFNGFRDYGFTITGPNGTRIPYRIQQPMFSSVSVGSSILVQTK